MEDTQATSKELKPVVSVKGRFVKGVVANPLGRPRGSLNKFSKIKHQLLEIFEKGKGNKRLLKYVTQDEKRFYSFVKDLILPILQKEDTSKSSSNTNNYYTVIRFD
jgi:hypothetical protein